ncbi:cytochrome d ubiquinol oxidase subunit II [Motilibacter aurantiacus]|uniref:cytochrome d ubiquinol oxidase subunit II n=1 Tax=Motilibacter aurantiacus TaxID=2714955 RepID=UPI0014088A49|nr:cytochrome d ubiquinol oxidase subunit II [Motilibacter aurantiacus]NHC46680.1 cytochrome d ubiquinol oxidase subunit II [Motilibacter aurantiacus]
MALDLPTVWLVLAIASWVAFFVLEGFDFGVGMLVGLTRGAHREERRGVLVRTIGPVWDGNEVWLVAAVGVMFAAFPAWYASLLSGLYLPMVLVLLALAVRGVALEFRGKVDDPRWRARCDMALAAASLATAALFGAVLAVLAQGLPLGPDGEVRGTGAGRSLGLVLTGPALLGAVAGVAACLLQGAAFLALRTEGRQRQAARRAAGRLAPAVGLAAALAGLATGAGLLVLAGIAAGLAGLAALRAREALTFAASSSAVALAVVAVFASRLPTLMPSTLAEEWSLTLHGGAASPYALRALSVAAVVILPGVLVYQAWSYWVFRQRVAGPRVAPVLPSQAARS